MNFSIVTPSYNQLDWLRLCVASVADQAGVEIEHIVQDAGTARVGEEWPDPGNTLRVFVETDAGMYDAINRGLARAGGEVCAWLNCDEQYLPGTLARVAAFFAEHPRVDLVFGDAILVDPAGCALSYRRAIPPERRHVQLCHLNTLSCATFFRRSLVERGFLFNPRWKMIGDSEWVTRLLDANVPMAVLPEPLAVFTFTGSNLSDVDGGGAREQAQWRVEPGAPPRWLRTPLKVRHRWEKFRAGAYGIRDLDYRIFTRDSADARVRFQVPGVGSGWPGQTAPSVTAAANPAVN